MLTSKVCTFFPLCKVDIDKGEGNDRIRGKKYKPYPQRGKCSKAENKIIFTIVRNEGEKYRVQLTP